MSVSDEASLDMTGVARESRTLWRIEPGKEETFEYLRGWLLRRQRRGAVEYEKPSGPERRISARPPEVGLRPWRLAVCGRPPRGSRTRLMGRTLL